MHILSLKRLLSQDSLQHSQPPMVLALIGHLITGLGAAAVLIASDGSPR